MYYGFFHEVVTWGVVGDVVIACSLVSKIGTICIYQTLNHCRASQQHNRYSLHYRSRSVLFMLPLGRKVGVFIRCVREQYFLYIESGMCCWAMQENNQCSLYCWLFLYVSRLFTLPRCVQEPYVLYKAEFVHARVFNFVCVCNKIHFVGARLNLWTLGG